MAQLPYFETLEVTGWLPALQGMRAPLKSYDRNDTESEFVSLGPLSEINGIITKIGPNDYKLAKSLCQSGPEHRKWMRQIQVWAKFNLSLYQHQEADTYMVGVTKNSESTMHTLMKRPLGWDDFDTKYMSELGRDDLTRSITIFNSALVRYKDDVRELETLKESKKEQTTDWDASDEYKLQQEIEFYKSLVESEFIDLKSILPTSFIQSRFVNLNYEVLHNMYHQRKHHRLPQWSIDFVEWVKTLPYSEFITEEWPE